MNLYETLTNAIDGITNRIVMNGPKSQYLAEDVGIQKLLIAAKDEFLRDEAFPIHLAKAVKYLKSVGSL